MDIAEKRVYTENTGRMRLAVGTGAGLAIVGISGDVIGEFGLALRGSIRDLAPVGEHCLLAATGEDVRLLELGPDEGGVAEIESTRDLGAGAADAVTVHDGAVVAAGSDGIVRRAPFESVESDVENADENTEAQTADAENADSGSVDVENTTPWTELGEATVRAADGQLLAAADGVYRVDEDGIEHVGLDDVRDVAAAGPLAATETGCFRLGPGWTMELGDAFDVVAAAIAAPDASRQRAHAAAGSTLHERSDDDWREVDWPAEAPVAGVAYDGTGDDLDARAVTVDGTVLVEGEDDWRTRSIGLPDVTGCAVVR